MIFMQNKIISTWTCLQVLFGGTMENCLGAGQRKIRKFIHSLGRRGGLMVSALDSGSGGPGHCVVFLGKILYSHSASLHPGV